MLFEQSIFFAERLRCADLLVPVVAKGAGSGGAGSFLERRMDHLTPERRSLNMSKVRSKNTAPEMMVRSLVHRLGFRFRLHRKDLPGKPDLVFPGRKSVIFVHGCFWHGHDCRRGQLPKSHIEFWKSKVETNQRRDAQNIESLAALGWRTLVVWECETKQPERLADKIQGYLAQPVSGYELP